MQQSAYASNQPGLNKACLGNPSQPAVSSLFFRNSNLSVSTLAPAGRVASAQTSNSTIMSLQFRCESCGRMALGVFTSLKQIEGTYLCPTCAAKALRLISNPNLAQCVDCSARISIRAVACPQCGAPR